MNLTRRKDGFTLAELLVVVAIIGILVAVSIPIFSSQTTKAKAATDMANVRAAKAAAVAEYLSSGASGEATYYYDAAKGVVVKTETEARTIPGYGKSTSPVSNADNTPYENGTAHIVSIHIVEDGTQTASWVLGTESGGGSSSDVNTEISKLSSTKWETLRNVQYGRNIPAGTLVIEGTTQYLFYSNQDNYGGDLRNVVLSSSYNTGVFAGRVLKITSSTTVYTEKNFLSTFDGKTVPAGTIVNYEGTYVCLAFPYTASQWNLPIAGSNNWVTIK